jgi:hypothetical protein
MSLIPSAPFTIRGNRRQCASCNREKILLRQGYGETSVVVQAPTGLGKTYIFELLYPNLKTQAVFTVPTRALALQFASLSLNNGSVAPALQFESLQSCIVSRL